MSQIETRAQFPVKLRDLFKPFRYKVIRGGRGGAKSWGVARALLIKATQGPLQVLCAREFQSSIKESVHKLIAEQIQMLGYGALFDVQRDAIYGPTFDDPVRGRVRNCFVFIGLSDNTAENLKSYEGFDICWVEEAQVVTDRSWEILSPTLRRDEAEIWITFNPQLDTDATWARFVEKPPPRTLSIEMNWRDNPWFNRVLEEERQHAKGTLPAQDYECIWEGKCRPAISGAIYAQEMAQLFAEQRIGDYPYDAFHRVHPVFDLGWNDKMAIILAQRNISQLRVIEYLEGDHKTLDWYSRELRAKPYSYGTLYLPHDGESGDYRSGKCARDILEGLGWTVEVLPRTNVEDGIRTARMTFSQLYIDQGKCAGLIECLKRYRRNIPSTTREATTPVHDQYSHGADAWRYTAIAVPMMSDETGMQLPALSYPKAYAV